MHQDGRKRRAPRTERSSGRAPGPESRAESEDISLGEAPGKGHPTDPERDLNPESSQFWFSQRYWTKYPYHLYDKRTGTWWAFEKGKGWYQPNAPLLMREIIAEQSTKAKRSPAIRRLATVKQSLELASHKLWTAGDQWDRVPGVVGLPDGMALSLEDGKIRPAQREEYLTKGLRCAPSETDAEWERVVFDLCDGREELAKYVQVAVGYSLFGDPREQIFHVIQGPGATGKSQFLEVVAYAFSDYAQAAPASIFAATNTAAQQHPTDLASLDGPRFLHCSEVDEDASWNTTRLKALTGGDTIAARYMRRDFFEFKPQGVLWIALNDLPKLKIVSTAIRRRMRIIPSHKVIPEEERDTEFTAKWQRRDRCAQVVRWMIDGAAQYAKHGLPKCSTIATFTTRYLDTEDIQARFIHEMVEFTGDKNDSLSRTEMRNAFDKFADAEGRRAIVRNFYERLKECGADEVKRHGLFHLIGVRLSNDSRSGRNEATPRGPRLLDG